MARAEWIEDSETLEIAMELQGKYTEIFDGLDLGKIKFVRVLNSAGKRSGELKPCSFPYDIDSPYAYYLMVHDHAWKLMSKAQRTLTVMHLLYSVAPNGTDVASNNYAKTRKYDVKDYTVILSAAGGNYEWQTPGVEVVDPLGDEVVDPLGDDGDDGGDFFGTAAADKTYGMFPSSGETVGADAEVAP